LLSTIRWIVGEEQYQKHKLLLIYIMNKEPSSNPKDSPFSLKSNEQISHQNNLFLHNIPQ